MKRIIAIILVSIMVLIVGFSTACNTSRITPGVPQNPTPKPEPETNDGNVNTTDNHSNEMVYDWENSVNVLSNAIDYDIENIEFMVDYIIKFGIHGITQAELIRDVQPGIGGLLQIVDESSNIFRISFGYSTISKKISINSITDMQTGETTPTFYDEQIFD